MVRFVTYHTVYFQGPGFAQGVEPRLGADRQALRGVREGAREVRAGGPRRRAAEAREPRVQQHGRLDRAVDGERHALRGNGAAPLQHEPGPADQHQPDAAPAGTRGARVRGRREGPLQGVAGRARPREHDPGAGLDPRQGRPRRARARPGAPGHGQRHDLREGLVRRRVRQGRVRGHIGRRGHPRVTLQHAAHRHGSRPGAPGALSAGKARGPAPGLPGGGRVHRRDGRSRRVREGARRELVAAGPERRRSRSGAAVPSHPRAPSSGSRSTRHGRPASTR